MSRLANANYLRLGSRTKWTSSWAAENKKYINYLKEDFLLSKFLKNFCFKYGVPFFSDKHPRWPHDGGQRQEMKSQKGFIIANPFLEDTTRLYFSHFRISRKGNLMQIEMYFMDALLETRRQDSPLRRINASSNIFRGHQLQYRPLRNYNRFIQVLKSNIWNKIHRNYQNKPDRIKINFSVFYRNLQLAASKIAQTSAVNIKTKNFLLPKIFICLWNRKINLKQRLFISFLLRHSLDFILKFLWNTYKWTYKNVERQKQILFNEKKRRVLQILVRTLSTRYKRLSSHKIERLFKGRLKANFTIFAKLYILVLIHEYCCRASSVAFIQHIFGRRYLLFKIANRNLHMHLKSLLWPKLRTRPSEITFYGINNTNVTVNFLCNFITLRLGQYWSISQIIPSIARDLGSHPHLRGYKIVVSGRLTRRERASYQVFSGGAVSITTIDTKLSYAADMRVMRFGVVGIKVWLHHFKYRPIYYYFKFNNEQNKTFA